MPKGSVKDLLKFMESKTHKLDMCTSEFADVVDDSLKDTVDKLNTRLRELEVKLQEIESTISEEYKENGGQPSESDQVKLLSQMDVEIEAQNYSEHLSAIHQMKTIYLFRCVEIKMKDMISIAYPEAKTKGLFVWESMKAFFQGKGIDLPRIPGYEAVVDLKKVNNNLKHNSAINDEVNKMPEFSGAVDFSADNLNVFWGRISVPVKAFIPNLSEAIKNELYRFDISRINALAEEYAERMSQADAVRFARALIERYNP